MGMKLIWVFDELGVGGPVDPGYGVPTPPGIWPSPGHPSHPIAPGGRPPHIDNTLPPGVQPPIYLPPDGGPSHPIYPVPPGGERPDNSLPGGGAYPDQGLPGSQPGVDNTLPGGEAKPKGGIILIWVPGQGYRAFRLPAAKPDQGLPETPEPK